MVLGLARGIEWWAVVLGCWLNWCPTGSTTVLVRFLHSTTFQDAVRLATLVASGKAAFLTTEHQFPPVASPPFPPCEGFPVCSALASVELVEDADFWGRGRGAVFLCRRALDSRKATARFWKLPRPVGTN
jgi:hypothetical protein